MKCQNCGADLDNGVLFAVNAVPKLKCRKNTVVNVERKFLVTHVFVRTVAQI